MPHVLHPSTPSLAAKLPAQTKLPGVCMSIVGMLRLPTSPSCHVVQIWGIYWIAARAVAVTPRTFAHVPSESGRENTMTDDTKMTSKPWARQMRPIVTAVRQVCVFDEELVGSADARGKNIRYNSNPKMLSAFCPRVKISTYMTLKQAHCMPT